MTLIYNLPLLNFFLCFSITLHYFCSFCYVLLITKALLGNCIFQRSDKFKVSPCRFISLLYTKAKHLGFYHLLLSIFTLNEGAYHTQVRLLKLYVNPYFVFINMYLIFENWIRKSFPIIVLKSTVSNCKDTSKFCSIGIRI